MKYLLPQSNYYRANLHCHSTISDGAFTPEELKQIYKSRGYQILAITDHNITIAHPELEDDDFLLLTANEINIDQDPPIGAYKKTYHLNLYAKERNNLWQPFLPPKLYSEDAQRYVDLVTSAGLVRSYDKDTVNDIIAAANENGFLVCYNHPVWSMQHYPDYTGLKGLWAMEVYNTCTFIGGQNESNSYIYQDMLLDGQRLFPVAADDLHHRGQPKKIAGGWVMVGAEKLEYGAVMEALEKGDFYASTGPQIHSLSIENGTLSIDCSPAQYIKITTHFRRGAHILPKDDDSVLTHGEYDLNPWLQLWQENGDDAFLRIEVVGPDGSKAYTRAYRLSELL